MAGQRSDDWLMRQVETMGEVAAKLVASALGQEIADIDELQEHQVDGLLRDEFAHTRINLLDVRSAVSLLRPIDRALSYARLLARKAAIIRAERPDGHDPRLSHRALRVMLEASELSEPRRALDLDILQALVDDLDPGMLDERERELLAGHGVVCESASPPDGAESEQD